MIRRFLTITLIVQPAASGPLSNTAIVQVQPSAAFTGVPALDGKALMFLAALLASLGMWMVRRRN